MPTYFQVLTKPQQILFVQQNLFAFNLKHYLPLSNPTKFIEAILSLISRCKDEDVSPEDYLEFVKSLKKFKFVLVDEYQDTNYAQNELVKLLANSHKNVCVVGDDDQSIYKFRGAAISNILKFKNDYKKTEQIVLTQNYRSNQSLLDSSYRLIRFNDPDRLEVRNRINKKLVAIREVA